MRVWVRAQDEPRTDGGRWGRAYKADTFDERGGGGAGGKAGGAVCEKAPERRTKDDGSMDRGMDGIQVRVNTNYCVGIRKRASNARLSAAFVSSTAAVFHKRPQRSTRQHVRVYPQERSPCPHPHLLPLTHPSATVYTTHFPPHFLSLSTTSLFSPPPPLILTFSTCTPPKK